MIEMVRVPISPCRLAEDNRSGDYDGLHVYTKGLVIPQNLLKKQVPRMTALAQQEEQGRIVPVG